MHKRLLVGCSTLLIASTALAEKDEKVVGVTGGLFLPSFHSQSPTAPGLGGWGVGGFGQYGLTHDLSVGLAFEVTSFSGEAQGRRIVQDHQPYVGELRFNGTLYHPQLCAEYKLYAGYNLAPYIEASVGYLWATYRDQVLVNEDNQSFGLDIEDLGQGSPTVSVALAVDYRLLDLVMVGIAPRYTYVPRGLLTHVVTLPLTVAYYW